MAAPKGNKFALGHGWGRPPRYSSPEEMLPLIQQYFDLVTTPTGICKPTISGLIFHLGFESRTAWYEYLKKEDFKYTLKRVELFLESCYEANLHTYNWGGSAFALRNIASEHWKEETTQNQIVSNVRADFGGVVQASQEPEANT